MRHAVRRSLYRVTPVLFLAACNDPSAPPARARWVGHSAYVAPPNQDGVSAYLGDQAAFDAAVGGSQIVVSFDDVAAGTDVSGLTMTGIRFDRGTRPAPGSPLIVVRGADTFTPPGFVPPDDDSRFFLQATSGTNVLSPGGVRLSPGPNPLEEEDDLVITFETPVSAVGFDVLFQEMDEFAYTSVEAYDADGNMIWQTLPTNNLPYPWLPTSRPEPTDVLTHGAFFVGLVADQPKIKTIVVDDLDNDAGFRDANLGFDSFRLAASAVNRRPVVSAGGPYSAVEGSALSLNWSATDADGDALTYTWDFGDGMTGSGGSLPASHTYADNGTYAVTLSVSDGRGGTAATNASVTVANAAPTIGSLTGPLNPIQLVSGAASATITLAFADAGGTADRYSATYDCGNGTTSTLTNITSPKGIACTYSTAGVYTARVTVRDEDGATSPEGLFQYVVVYDPNGGFVTGGGWFTSPSAACPVFCAGASGRANFGFVAKYLPGRSTPDGNTEFEFSAGNLNFKSTAYETLIVGGNRAQYWGTGTVNGVAGYSFRLTAVDGQVTGNDGTVDKLRIEIWQSGNRIYDNQWNASQEAQLTTAIGGGNISIKR